MSNTNETESKKTLSLSGRGRMELRKAKEAGQVRQSFPHGRSKSVTVEVVKRKRKTASAGPPGTGSGGARGAVDANKGLTQEERQKRTLALRGAKQEEENLRRRVEEEAQKRAEEDEARRKAEAEAEEARRAAEEAKRRAEEEAEEQRRRAAAEEARADPTRTAEPRGRAGSPAARTPADAGTPPAEPGTGPRRTRPAPAAGDEDEATRARRGKPDAKRPSLATTRRQEPRRRSGKITVTQALDDSERTRSLASVRRQREREKRQAQAAAERAPKQLRDVVVPETITVQELANRMAERAGDVIKALMKMGVMATINQAIDADTAELIVNEFGHRIRRVAESDVEIGLKGDADRDEDLQKRPPVVTIMGHVDHGKTSLLDALRETDVAAREAGGITQHIGAYQIALSGGDRITFLDTPGHEAFTQMRARGATVTDIVVLVVAADDGIMAQTVEAIRHAQAAEVPIIVAINKMDRPDANPERVRQELLQHGLVVESMGGDVLTVEVSAKGKTGLDKLEEAILLQAELLELQANPDRPAEGTVVEAKLERGRGAVATVLVERGTLRVGDVFVAGSEWGRVRALIDDRGQQVESAGPAAPVEVLGLNGSPNAGEDVAVVENEARAREVTEYRQRRDRDARTSTLGPTSIADFFKAKKDGVAKEFPVVVKADVQGSAEAIVASLDKLETNEVKARVLLGAVGGISESDVTLAQASGALIIGFNVRANPQARELARREGVEIRYYSVIYNVVDDIKQILGGMLSPEQREKIIGNAEIRKVFAMSKAGKVAGCMITDGQVKRGAGVRLLRDDVVIHEGKLKTLKRFKDEVAEVREGYECGMAFENYQDIQEGDVIECFEVEEVQRTL